MMFFNEFLFNDCIIQNIKIFVMFNEIFIINNLFFELFAQAARRRRLFNMKYFYLLIFCLKFLNQKFH